MNNYLRILQYLEQFIDDGKFHVIENLANELDLGEEEFKRFLYELKGGGYLELIENGLVLDQAQGNPEIGVGNIIELKLQARITLKGHKYFTKNVRG